MRRFLVGCVTLAVVASGIGALVWSISTASASVTTFTATADATITSDSPAKNYGATTSLVADASPVRSFLVKFDVQTGGCAPFTKATLSLSVGNGASDNSPHGGVLSSAGTGWAEGTVTWSSAPPAGATLGTLGAVAKNATYVVDVSAAVTTDGPVAFRMDSPNPDGVYYLSKEGSATNPPRLTVTCGGGTTTTPTASTTSTSSTTSTTTLPAGDPPCVGASAPATYRHVIVVMEENRTWSAVGPAFASMPYMHSLAATCAYYPDWTETNPAESSLTQYIGLTSGVNNPATVGDCAPSPTCRSVDDNIFRQVRAAGGIPRSYVEGATTGCGTTGVRVSHVPALYYYGGSDNTFCQTEVRPLTEFDVTNLPTFALVTPNACNDGHDCGNDVVDAWLRGFLPPIFATPDYVAGTTAVLVIYDEDRPVPNLLIAQSAKAGPIAGAASHALALHTIESMLNLPRLGDLRTSSGL